jgi:mRNA interferase MazF
LKKKIRQFEIWIADLNPQIGTEPGKTRPVLILQTDLLNQINHPSTIIFPLTSNVKAAAEILRVHLKKGEAGLQADSDIMIDQLRAIDNQRLLKKSGDLPVRLINKIKQNISIVLDLDGQ